MAWRVRRARRARGARGAWRAVEGFWALEGVVMLEGPNLGRGKSTKYSRRGGGGDRVERRGLEGWRVRRPDHLNDTPTLAGGRAARPALAPV